MTGIAASDYRNNPVAPARRVVVRAPGAVNRPGIGQACAQSVNAEAMPWGASPCRQTRREGHRGVGRRAASVAGIVGHMDPDDKPIDATADPVDKPAEDTVLFSNDAGVQAEPFIQTNIS